MFRADNVQFLQAKWCLVRMAQDNACTRPFRTVYAFVQLEYVLCAKEHAWIPWVFVLSSIIADNLHAQPSRFDLTVVPVLYRTF